MRGSNILPTTVNYNGKIEKIYDGYYGSEYYSSRYPVCNLKSLSCILESIEDTSCATVLDYGCGNGRYAIPILRKTNAEICLFDISSVAMKQLDKLLSRDDEKRILERCHDICRLSKNNYDLIICMFGVLSHIPLRNKRLSILQMFYNKLSQEGKLILSVPNKYRRLIFSQFKHSLRRLFGSPEYPATETRDIIYGRKIDGTKEKIFYHLYSKNGLISDLNDAGFCIKSIMPESILPEKMVVSSDLLRKIDALLLKILPTSLGYGFLVVASKEVT